MSPPIATSDLDSERNVIGVNGSSASTAYAGDGCSNGVHSNGLNSNSVHSNDKTPGAEPIAICGMALRLPGGLHTPQQFWDFLVAKGDARGRVPESRYKIEAYYSAIQKPSTVKTEYGYFLDESANLGHFDTSLFNMRRDEVGRSDPQQRLMLEVVRECMEDAGETNWRGKRIGCYMGNFGEDWLEMISKESQQYGLYRSTGCGDFMLPNRISYEFDIHGPSMLIRTACSSALVALHEACQSITRGDCVSAIVGGANIIMAPDMTCAMSEQGVLAADGSCKTFSADANGYARGEAINAVFVKTLADALRDGNPVRAVIRSTASVSDGKSPAGAFAPNGVTQEHMMRRAYDLAGITDFSKTAFVECHGTGTAIGDPIETKAVAKIFGSANGVYIGSVKPNLGHSEGASGLTSLIKAVLALEHRIIPPNIKFSKPNPAIQWDAGLKVPIEPMPWPEYADERVSVNSFGIGGSDAHVILDSARSFGASRTAMRAPDTPQLLLFSGATQESLKQLIENYKEFLEQNPESIGDLAYTLSNRREHLSYRAFAVAAKHNTVTVSPIARSGQVPNVVMMFTGQGAQWPQMGRELLQDPTYTIFQQSIKSLDKYLQASTIRPEWSIEEELLKGPKTSRLNTAEFSQPLCTAIQISLVNTLASIGVVPAAVVGHSSGELAAAYASGAITAKEAIVGAFYRGAAAKLQTKPGAMAAIGLGRDEVEKYLTRGVIIACENSPKSVTLSGDVDKVNAVVASIQDAQPDILARVLRVDKAYHSHHMLEIGDKYYALIAEEIFGKEPNKLFFSSVTGQIHSQGTAPLSARYWQKNLESPVLFSTAVTALLKHEIAKNAVFLEIGPHSGLAGPLRQIQTQNSNSAPYIPTMLRHQDCIESFLSAIGKLCSLNVRIDFKKLIPSGTTLPGLPTYPWNHSETYWYESRLSKEWRHREHPYHDLLGVRILESIGFEPVWRNLFHLENAPWVRDHKVKDDVVFPFAGYAGMIGEAVRQVSGIQTAFTLRHVVVNTALVLSEAKPTEIMTSFRRSRLTDYLDSEWWEFTISSYNGHMWSKHCTGQVKAQAESLGRSELRALPPRKVAARRCYDSMRRSGLNFGPTFRRLEEIRSETTRQVATAMVVIKQDEQVGYHLHPTLIDASMQLLTVAATKGCAGQVHSRTLLPTNIEELSVHRCSSNLEITASATFTLGGGIMGKTKCTAAGQVVLEISGLRLTAIDEGGEDEDIDTTARPEWGPHIDFVDPKSLIRQSVDLSLTTPLLDDLTQLCMISSQRRLVGLKSDIPHMQKYASWIGHQLKTTNQPKFTNLDNAALENLVSSLVERLSETPAADAAMAIYNTFIHIRGIFTGTKDALEMLLDDDRLGRIYEFMDQCDQSPLLKRLCHSKPSLRVLEIGAGTGATTKSILKDLAPSGGHILYSQYVYTDISTGMFVAATEKFKDYPNIEYATLDISKGLAHQGFEGREFDLIIASNVIHATKSLQDSLQNVRKLLAPNGRFFLTELNSTSKWVNYIWGTLPGWWLGEQDGRFHEPYVSPRRWELELRTAGFDGLDAVVLDSEEPHQLNAMMIAKPSTNRTPSKHVTLLCHEISKPGPILGELERRGYTVDRRLINESPLPAGQDVIAVLDKDQPFFEKITSELLEAFKKLITTLDKSGIFWVTNPCQMHCPDPRYAQVIGIARTVRSEVLVDFATCEVDNIDSSLDVIADVFAKFQLREEDKTFKPEMEYAISNRSVNVGRIFPFSLKEELSISGPNDRVSLRTNRPGRLADLHWSQKAQEVLQGDFVEIETYATGLNFKDVLCAMGIVESSGDAFGLEAAGVLCRIGPDVKDLKVGDRVILLGHSSFATHTVISEQLCAKMPDKLSFEDGATMPCVFSTSIYSLFNIGGLQKGQSVLIHSACGGVGIASIQLAKMVGAEIYATAGNNEKVEYLMKTFSLPRNRIFNSRNTSFLVDVMRETNGRGVDLALNSLSGELLHATWKCVAPCGKLVEIGKRDLLGAGKLDMSPFLDNRSYCCVDLDQLCNLKPAICKDLLNLTIEYFKAGHVLPIRPIKAYPASSIREAFRYMQQGLHMGKIVISMRDASGELNLGTDVEKRQRLVTFDGSASYLLVGGLGGLGRSVSTWMIDRGARHLIYLSRSANPTSEKHQDFLREVESMGCKVDLVQGSVSSADDVRKAVDAGKGNLKGILQMSMVLCDRAFTRMTLEEWNTATAPKIEGTWNLHNSTLAVGANLDFFVLFSSISGVIGQPGQANYAGANTFLDAFVQYRTALGLPASVVDIGAVQEVGYVARNDALLRRLKTSGAYGVVSEQGVLDSMAAAMTCLSNGITASSNGRSTFICRRNFALGLRSRMSLKNPDNRAIWRKDIRMAQFHNDGIEIDNAAGATTDVLQSFLAKARHDAALLMAPGTATLLTTEIGKKLFSFLLKPEEDLDVSASLAALGMDSLVAIEMRAWWKQTFGFDVSVLEMLGMGTLEALGKHAAETLQMQIVEGSEETGKPEAELSK